MSAELSSRLGYEFRQTDLLRRALTHRSFFFENKTRSAGHFERLEFLGDAVLGMAVSELLMNTFPDVDEGTLSKWRASLVNEASLADVAREIELAKFLHLGRSEDAQRASPRPRLLASAYEALVAAVYLDGGLDAVKSLILRHFAPRVRPLKVDDGFKADFKTRLQEWAQAKHRVTPTYRLLDATGPEHEKTFRYEVSVNGASLAAGEGSSRKAAEQNAAALALKQMGAQ